MLPETRRRRAPAVVLAAVLSFGAAAGSEEAYRLTTPDSDTLGWIVNARHVRNLWQGWEPGETLAFTLDSSADWSVFYGGQDQARRVVETALAAWANLPNADISWELAGVKASDYGEEGPKDMAENWVSIDPLGEYRAAAYSQWDKEGDEWKISGCMVLLGNWATEPPPDWLEELPVDDPRRTHNSLHTIIHEFGHCLGLDHAQRLPVRSLLEPFGENDQRTDRSAGFWFADPMMSYGWSDFGIDHPLTADDATGAALLRPAPGWLETTGSISGSLVLAGEPVPHAHIWAFPEAAMPEGGRPRPIGGFSNEDGNFLIEGLRPGRYALWVSPLTEPGAHGVLLGLAKQTLGEHAIPWPVLVEAGSVAEAGTLQLHWRRE